MWTVFKLNQRDNLLLNYLVLRETPRQVVGLLIRARKYKLVEFEGETLFQGRDDQTPVYLLR